MAGSLKNKGFVNEINVTPFVDVMLVLLIIFMVTAPMMTEGIDVELPKTQSVSALPTDVDYVILSLQKNGTIMLNEYTTSIDDLSFQLNATVAAQKKQLFLKADKDVPYGVVVDIMGRVRAAGIKNMGIVAERLEEVPQGTAKPGQPARSR